MAPSRFKMASSLEEQCLRLKGEGGVSLKAPRFEAKGGGVSLKELVVWGMMRKCEGVLVAGSAASWCGERGGRGGGMDGWSFKALVVA